MRYTQTAAMTSHAALMVSPRPRAMMANAAAPRAAIASHRALDCVPFHVGTKVLIGYLLLTCGPRDQDRAQQRHVGEQSAFVPSASLISINGAARRRN